MSTVVTRGDGGSRIRSWEYGKRKLDCSAIEWWMWSRLGYFYDGLTAFVSPFLAMNMMNAYIQPSTCVSACIN